MDIICGFSFHHHLFTGASTRFPLQLPVIPDISGAFMFATKPSVTLVRMALASLAGVTLLPAIAQEKVPPNQKCNA
jgi:hypothetical protein